MGPTHDKKIKKATSFILPHQDGFWRGLQSSSSARIKPVACTYSYCSSSTRSAVLNPAGLWLLPRLLSLSCAHKPRRSCHYDTLEAEAAWRGTTERNHGPWRGLTRKGGGRRSSQQRGAARRGAHDGGDIWVAAMRLRGLGHFRRHNAPARRSDSCWRQMPSWRWTYLAPAFGPSVPTITHPSRWVSIGGK